MGDDRKKHPICDMCLDLKMQTTYLCGDDCPANPGAWQLHGLFHKEVKKQRKSREDGGVVQQRYREVAERQAFNAAVTGDKYHEVLAKAALYNSKNDSRRAGKAYREAIALRPDEPLAYYNLGSVLKNSGHFVETSQRYLEAMERSEVGSELWGNATAGAFGTLMGTHCNEVAKPEWWNDEELKALSTKAVRVAPNDPVAQLMQAHVLSGACGAAWEVGPRSAADLKEAATHFDRAAALNPAPAGKAKFSAPEQLARRRLKCVEGVEYRVLNRGKTSHIK